MGFERVVKGRAGFVILWHCIARYGSLSHGMAQFGTGLAQLWNRYGTVRGRGVFFLHFMGRCGRVWDMITPK